LSYALDVGNGLSVCYCLYRGNVVDVEDFLQGVGRTVTPPERT
jgi:hypothetical protein